MKTKDFINIGVFTAIYFVVLFGFGMLGVINPAMMFVGYALGIIANGVVVFLFKARAPKFGTLGLMALLVGALMVLTGHPWVTVLLTFGLGLLGDYLFTRGKRYLKILGYALMSLWYVAPWFPVLTDAEGYYQYIAGSMGTEYADGLRWFLSPTMIAIWGVAVFVLGIIGGFFGDSVLRRHFRTSGIAR
ncbi:MULTISPECIES: MptD family putative ECF transporter S component [Actinomycetaceae]|uniref:TIGR02185 family protein n=4 Tax=Actinotignum TaxID=1653174 RepID=S2WLJ4_9ACTO|nr:MULTISPECIES: MptD family putative ECF transporter S component [Actinotignum]AIE83123.1 permease [Actinotignum schaalii]EPD28719.1 hypothetical protein HMPREF9237_00247 [Actinotignum schaalii FB123-CNA-2]MBS5748867.1 MptD family putative ECF transporter S component [Actinotignum schaalii]MDE1536632.1 MptD family putative ECF transporter S component [Actinotignum schaalii]MDE1557455.1 MptD family putative ECF transporter S component [Actinotignum schaalii]